ncbi:DUF721 domain-containing protein [Candidatus Nitrospira bockiana]
MASFISLAAALDGVVARLGLSAKLAEQRLARDWPLIVGEPIAAHTRPDAIRYKKLYLIARNSMWLQQLLFLKPVLIDKITRAAGEGVVTDIVLRVGEIPEHPAGTAPPANRAETPAAPPQALLDEAARHAGAVQDPETRARLTQLMARALTATPGATKKPERAP